MTLDKGATPKDSSPEPGPGLDGSKRHWWVQSDEGDGQVIDATDALEAVKRWAASEWSDVEDGQPIEALDLALLEKFVARQTNEIADDDMDTDPEFEFLPEPSP